MERDEAHKRLRQLYKFIWKARYEYYILDKPSVSDAVYDDLFRTAERIEREHPDLKAELLAEFGWEAAPTDVVGSPSTIPQGVLD